jgi:hypothetical protein
LRPKQILKYFLYSGYGPEIEKDENITIEEIVDRLTTDEKETLIFITQRMIHYPSEKANLLEFFEGPEKMKEEYIQLLEWYYENIFSSVEEDIRKLNEEKLKELKKRIPDVREKTLEKLSLSSSDIVKKSNIYIGVSYYLGIMAASATLSLDKKGYVFVIGYDRMEFMDIEQTQTVSCAEVFGSLGHPQRILIVKELLKGETTITKLAKKTQADHERSKGTP